MAAPTMQGVAQQLVLDRRVGSYVLPDGWFVWAAGNRKQDRASVFENAVTAGQPIPSRRHLGLTSTTFVASVTPAGSVKKFWRSWRFVRSCFMPSI